MNTAVASPLLVCLSLVLLPTIQSEGFPSIEEIQNKAVFLSRYTNHGAQWEIFPYIFFSCDCKISSLIFIATEQPHISSGESTRFQFWIPSGNTDSTFTLVTSVVLEREKLQRLSPVNMNGMSVLRLTLDSPLELPEGAIFGTYQPSLDQSDLALQFQLGLAPDSYQRPNTAPTDTFTTVETIVNNDYPLVAVEHSCPDRCLSGFLGREGVESYFNTNPNAHLENYQGVHRLIPALNFTCNTAITSVKVGAKKVFGFRTPRVRIWRLNGNVLVNTIRLRNMAATEHPGVYERTLNEPIPVQEGDAVSVYEPLFSELKLYDEVNAGLYPPNDFLEILTSQPLPGNDNHPLLTIETRDQDCTAGFMTSTELARKSLSLALSTNFNYLCVVPDVQFPRDGLLSKVMYAGQFIQSRGSDNTLYPEIQIWRAQGSDEYKKVASFSTAPQFTTNVNVYEVTFDPPVQVEEGYVLGYYQPRSSESMLGLVSVQDSGPENYCIYGRNPDNISTQSNFVAAFSRTPLVTFEYVDDNPSSTPNTSSSLAPSNTPSTSSSRGGKSGTIAGVVAGGVVGGLVVVALIVGVVFLILILWRRQKRDKPKETQHFTGMQNPTFNGTRSSAHAADPRLMPPHKTKPPLASSYKETSRESWVATIEREYHNIEPNGKAEVMATSSPHYGWSANHQNGKEPRGNIYYQDGMETRENIYYTPIEEEQEEVEDEEEEEMEEDEEEEVEEEEFLDDDDEPTESYENFYADLSKPADVTDAQGSSFLEEEVLYWEPASDALNLYRQLKSRNYKELPRKQISLGDHLGSGQFGTVSQGVWFSPQGRADVAVKTLKPGSCEEDKVKFLQEAAINGQFKHPNVVKLIGVVTVGEPVMIVLELMSNGDLANFLQELRSPDRSFPNNLSQKLLDFCQDIASGMEYLAGKSFVHRDLAARNILVSENQTCKISDFGMSRDMEDDTYYVSTGGKIPVKWTAPEAINYKKYSTASDVWSFGMVMYEIWSLGHKPFEGYTNSQCVKLVERGFSLPPPSGCPREIYRMIILCWNPNKSSRPSFASLSSLLGQSPSQILYWSPQDAGSAGPQAVVLGGGLKAGTKLYPDLQKTYYFD